MRARRQVYRYNAHTILYAFPGDIKPTNQSVQNDHFVYIVPSCDVPNMNPEIKSYMPAP